MASQGRDDEGSDETAVYSGVLRCINRCVEVDRCKQKKGNDVKFRYNFKGFKGYVNYYLFYFIYLFILFPLLQCS